MHVRTGDKVVVVSGKDKGKESTVLKAIPSKNRVVVEDVNMVKKHQKPSQMNPEGGILETEAPIHVSNVMHVDPETGERTRIRHEVKEDGTKVRIAVKSGKEIPAVKYEKN